MILRQDARVTSAVGEDVGHVYRVVIDPSSDAVTHVVVRRGLLVNSDKVVPMSLVASGDEDGVRLRVDAAEVQGLPDYEEVHYTLLNEEELARRADPEPTATPVYWYPPFGLMGGPVPIVGPGAGLAAAPGYVAERKTNIPAGTVALKEGTKVIDADGEGVGRVHELLTDPRTGQVTHFVVGRGRSLKHRRLVPMTWVRDLTETEVHLSVGGGVLRAPGRDEPKGNRSADERRDGRPQGEP